MAEAARPAGASRDPALDGLRGFATLWIFVYHYGGGLQSHNPLLRLFGYVTQAGWVGVEIFFALSGFLITESLMQVPGPAHGVRNYFARRALRILPLYYAAVLASCVAALVVSTPLEGLEPALLYAVFVQNLPWVMPQVLGFSSPLPVHHLWSLAVEAQFYLLWPVLVLPLARGRLWRPLAVVAVALFLGLCLLRAAIFLPAPFAGEPLPFWAGFLPVRAGALVLGGAVAAALQAGLGVPLRRWAGPVVVGAVSVALGVGLWCGGLLLARPAQMILTLAAVEAGCAATVLLVLEPTWLRRLCASAVLRIPGRLSYGFYVFHLLLQPLFDGLATHLTHAEAGNLFQAARFALALPITLAAAWLSYELLELPFLTCKRFFPLRRPLSDLMP